MSGFANPDAYEQWMGRWSARVAPAFVAFARLPSSGRYLDVGCGTGALTAALLEAFENAHVVGIDPSQGYVAHCRDRFDDPRVAFEDGDAKAIPFESSSFDGSLALLILQEIPDAPGAVREMCRVTRPGGIVATSQWRFAGGMPMLALFWETAIETLDEPATRDAAAEVMEVDYPDGNALRRLWKDAGLVDVEAEAHDINMTFSGFDDYWKPFLSGVTMSASFAAGLDVERRHTLEEGLRGKLLGDGADRPFDLPAQTWAVRGTVPRR